MNLPVTKEEKIKAGDLEIPVKYTPYIQDGFHLKGEVWLSEDADHKILYHELAHALIYKKFTDDIKLHFLLELIAILSFEDFSFSHFIPFIVGKIDRLNKVQLIALYQLYAIEPGGAKPFILITASLLGNEDAKKVLEAVLNKRVRGSRKYKHYLFAINTIFQELRQPTVDVDPHYKNKKTLLLQELRSRVDINLARHWR